MKYKSIILIGLAVALGVPTAGCLDEGAPAGVEGATGESSNALLWWFPLRELALTLEGHGLNGRTMTGGSLDGRVIVSVSLEGVRVSARHTRTLRLEATEFKGERDLVGAELTATLDDASTLLLRIDAVLASSAGRDAYNLYAVSYATTTDRVALCGLDAAGQAIPAVPFNGRWDLREGAAGGGSWIADDRAFTFGCTGHVLAKCVDLGYRPWAEGRVCTVDGRRRTDCVRTSLQPYHQACTRALRADFCGNGVSYTVDGTPIGLSDGVGIRADIEEGSFEAEWTPDGARCAAGPRLAGAEYEPPCLAALLAASPDCGALLRFEDRITLLMTEVLDAPGAGE